MPYKFCPNCGTQLGEGVKFCGGCGQRVAAPTQRAAEGPQAVIPRSAAQRSRGAQPRPASSSAQSSQAAPPVIINVNGSPVSAQGYYGRQGYRCNGCGGFLYQGGPGCPCGFGFSDFLGLGLGVMLFDDLFFDGDGGLGEDMMVAGMLAGGGIGYGQFGGGGLLGELLVAEAVGDMFDNQDRDRDDDQGGYEEPEDQGGDFGGGDFGGGDF